MKFSSNYIKADNAYRQEQFQLAIKTFNRELSIKAKNHLAFLGKAKALTKQGEVNNALLHFQKCILNVPEKQKLEYIEGCYSFLLANDKVHEANTLISNQEKLLPLDYKKEHLLNLVLDEEQNEFFQFANSISNEENTFLVNEILTDELISGALKDKVTDYYFNYLENERIKLNKQLSSNESFIRGLEEQFQTLKLKFEELKQVLSNCFNSIDTGFEAINEGQNFLESALYKILWDAEKKRNLDLIKNHVEANKEEYHNYNLAVQTFITFLNYADKTELTDTTTKPLVYEHELDIELNKETLNGINFGEVQDMFNLLNLYTEKSANYTEELKTVIEEEFNRLKGLKKHFKAAKIAHFMVNNGEKKVSFINAISFAKRKKIVYSLSGLLVIGILCAGGLFLQSKINEKKLYEEALSANTHYTCAKYLEEYPNGEYVTEIKLNDQFILYKTAMETQQIKDINKLIKLYPNSNWLRKVEFEKRPNLTYNINTTQGEKLIPFEGDYLVPLGLPIKYQAYANSSQVDFGFLQVVDDCKIDTNTVAELKKDHVYFCNLAGLNVRENGHKSDIIQVVYAGYPFKLLGERSEKANRVTFYGEEIKDFYYRVALLDGTIGWVHGAALKTIAFEKEISFETYKKVNKSENYLNLN